MKPDELHARLAELGQAWDERDMKTLVDQVKAGLRRLADDPVEQRRIEGLALRIDDLPAESDGPPEEQLDDADPERSREGSLLEMPDVGQTPTPANTEAELLSAFAAGDEEAVGTIYRRYAGPIRTVASRALGRGELADEAVQTTMLKAWRASRSSSFDTSRELAPWLYAIARRVAIDIYRREQQTAPSPADEDLVTALSFERKWEESEVRAALARLPIDERQVVRLSHVEGLTHQEIAERLQVPVGTVKSRSHRAHRRLAGLLDDKVTPATDKLDASEQHG